MQRRWWLVPASAMLGFFVLAGLSGCGALMPETGSYLKTLGPIIQKAVPGATRVSVSSGIDGATRYVWVEVALDENTQVTADLARTVIRLVDEHQNQPGASRMDISFRGGSDGELVDVSAIRDELSSDPLAVAGDDWSLVVDFKNVKRILRG
jgi:hypothetical protein